MILVKNKDDGRCVVEFRDEQLKWTDNNGYIDATTGPLWVQVCIILGTSIYVLAAAFIIMFMLTAVRATSLALWMLQIEDKAVGRISTEVVSVQLFATEEPQALVQLHGGSIGYFGF